MKHGAHVADSNALFFEIIKMFGKNNIYSIYLFNSTLFMPKHRGIGENEFQSC